MGDRPFKAKGRNIGFVGILNGNTKNIISCDYQDNDRISAEEIIREFEEEKKNEDFLFPDFSDVNLTPQISFIVDEITNSYHCDRGLVLLALLASIAGLDRGKRIVQIDRLGQVNTLSILILGCAESCAGKSKIIDTYVKIIEKIQPKQTDIESIDQKLNVRRLKFLEKQYAKIGDESLKNEIYEIHSLIEASRQDNILTSNITKPALIDMIAKQGFIFRMESEGTQFNEDSYEIVRKLWSNEGHSEAVISREANSYSGGLIVSLEVIP